ncbi:MAG: efflux transporter outer membrane subunit [Syntrophales bacterium]|nr:efflux transporter outer membrane subunit [Syntrophales bacterium]
MRRIVLFFVFVFIIYGCTFAPEFQRPATPVPDSWPKGEAYSIPVEGAKIPTEIKWQDFFADGKLCAVISEALKNNRDLKLAVLNVERVRALYGIQRAELLPSINAAGTMAKERVPADLSSTRRVTTQEKYSVNLGISAWEIDFSGRLRSLKDRMLEEYLATEQASRGVRAMLIASVANAYFSLAADRENLRIATSTLKTQQEMFELMKKRYEVGLISEIDLKRAQSQLEAARGDVARFTQLVAQSENALFQLVGSTLPPELLPDGLDHVKPPQDVTPGIPSEVLLKRPDILEAEHRLKAANANIGAARAAFFPRIALTASVGTASAELSNLFKSGQGTWNFMPQIVMPIFDARTWAAYDAAKAEREMALTKYEKVIQEAFREVADALAIRGTVTKQLEAQQSLVEALNQTYILATTRYMRGLDSYLSVLDAQRSLNDAKKGLVNLRLVSYTNLVTLYKVLGGGS